MSADATNMPPGEPAEDGSTMNSTYRRNPPHRKHFYSWVASDREQLHASEQMLLQGLNYYQATVVGLNTISTDDIGHLDDSVCVSASSFSDGAAATRSGESSSARDHGQGGSSRTGDPQFNTDASDAICSHVGTRCDDGREIVLLLHGFAGGVAFWAQNWQFLSASYRVYGIDLPGFARSERPDVTVQSLDDAMSMTADWLHRWVRVMRFSRPLVIVAHSFGCFIGAHYIMRKKSHAFVKCIVMTEPWGINRPNPERLKRLPLLFRLLVHVLLSTNPLALLRGCGPFGPALVKRFRPDFYDRWKEFLSDPEVAYDYIYHCNALSPPFGEMLFKACCHCDAVAKESLQDSMPLQLEKTVAVAMLFGEDSWMDKNEALALACSMQSAGFTVHTDIVPKAGHQLFTDNVEGFNQRVHELIQLSLYNQHASTKS